MAKFNIIPLLNVPLECFPTISVKDERLLDLRKTAEKVQGYFLVRELFTPANRDALVYFLQDSPRMSTVQMAGRWYLGRIKTTTTGYQVCINVNDPAKAEGPGTFACSRSVYGPVMLLTLLEGLNLRGSSSFLSPDTYFEWVTKRDLGDFYAISRGVIEGEVVPG